LKLSLYVRHIEYQNGSHLKSTYAITSGHNAANDLILVSKYFFLGGGNESNGTNFNLVLSSRKFAQHAAVVAAAVTPMQQLRGE